MDIPTKLPSNAHETQKTSEITVAVCGSIIVVVATALRFWGRWIVKRRTEAGRGKGEKVYGADDLFNILSVLAFFGFVTAVLIAIERGMGVHVEVILYKRGFQGLSDYNKAIYVSAIFYNTVLGLIKLSVLSLYRRILRGVQSHKLSLIVWIVFGIVVANTIANVLVAMFQCSPITAAWDVQIPSSEKRCIDINAFYLGNACTGLLTDFTVYTLSIPIVLPLKLDTKTKLQLMCTMLIGGFAVITSATRLAFIPSLLRDPDVSMAMAIPMNWSVAEPAVGILVSSMPAIRALRFLWRKPGEGTGSYGSSSGAGESSLRSRVRERVKGRNAGVVELVDMEEVKRSEREKGERNRVAGDGGSEERLVEGGGGYASEGTGVVGQEIGGFGGGGIERTTELEVVYSQK